LYVDKCGIIERGRAKAAAAVREASSAFAARGQPVHDLEVSVGPVDVLGTELDFVSCRARVSQKRYWRVRRCLDWVLRRGRISGRAL